MTDQSGNKRVTTSSSFGYYRFEDVVGSDPRRFRTVTVTDEPTGVDLVAEPSTNIPTR